MVHRHVKDELFTVHIQLTVRERWCGNVITYGLCDYNVICFVPYKLCFEPQTIRLDFLTACFMSLIGKLSSRSVVKHFGNDSRVNLSMCFSPCFGHCMILVFFFFLLPTPVALSGREFAVFLSTILLCSRSADLMCGREMPRCLVSLFVREHIPAELGPLFDFLMYNIHFYTWAGLIPYLPYSSAETFDPEPEQTAFPPYSAALLLSSTERGARRALSTPVIRCCTQA